MARAFASGTITFGLVAIPIKFYTASKKETVEFNLLSKENNRLKMQFVDCITGEVVSRDEAQKGYEYTKGQYVIFSKEELQQLESERSNIIEVDKFVSEELIKPYMIEKSLYVGPGKGGDKPYSLFASALKKTKRSAIGQYHARGRDYLYAIQSHNDALIAHQLYYANEIRPCDVECATFNFSSIEENLAEQLINQLSSNTLNLEDYKDSYRDQVLKAIDQKIAGQEVSIESPKASAKIMDLFEALQASLDQAKK